MKNLSKLLAIASLLLVANAHAKTQTIIIGTDDMPFSTHANVQFDMAGYSLKDDHGMGPKSIGAILGFNHYVGHDFEYGLNVFGGLATSLQGKLFAEAGKRDGFKAATNLNARYMPKVSSHIRLGAFMSVGYSRLFGDGHKAMHDAFEFGDTNFSVGPSFMCQASSLFSWGFGLSYGMTEMRFGNAKAGKAAKQYSNLHTFRIPFDFVFQATDKVGLSLALEPGWRELGGSHKFLHGLFYDIAAGANFSF